MIPDESVYSVACIDPASLPVHYATGMGDVLTLVVAAPLILGGLAVCWYAWRLRVRYRFLGSGDLSGSTLASSGRNPDRGVSSPSPAS